MELEWWTNLHGAYAKLRQQWHLGRFLDYPHIKLTVKRHLERCGPRKKPIPITSCETREDGSSMLAHLLNARRWHTSMQIPEISEGLVFSFCMRELHMDYRRNNLVLHMQSWRISMYSSYKYLSNDVCLYKGTVERRIYILYFIILATYIFRL